MKTKATDQIPKFILHIQPPRNMKSKCASYSFKQKPDAVQRIRDSEVCNIHWSFMSVGDEVKGVEAINLPEKCEAPNQFKQEANKQIRLL